MRNFLPPFFFTAAVALAAAPPVQAARPALHVYTYDSFVSEWGPGPRIKTAFEAQCECELKFVAVDGSAAILSRVQLEGKTSRADVVLGLDMSLTAEAKATGLLAPHNVTLDDAQLDLPVAWEDEIFLPFDYGYFAFIYDATRLPSPPKSFRELLAADDSLKILIQDPRSSTPGLGLLLWVKSVYGDDAFHAWRKLSAKIVTVTRGWSQAYGMFLDAEADMVLSYTTSQAYHIQDGAPQYRAAMFAEGHALQVEVAAQLKNAPQPQLAARFMQFILSEEFQSAIPEGNWMYPAARMKNLPEAFAKVPRPKISHAPPPQRIRAHKAEWVDEFRRALSE